MSWYIDIAAATKFLFYIEQLIFCVLRNHFNIDVLSGIICFYPRKLPHQWFHILRIHSRQTTLLRVSSVIIYLNCPKIKSVLWYICPLPDSPKGFPRWHLGFAMIPWRFSRKDWRFSPTSGIRSVCYSYITKFDIKHEKHFIVWIKFRIFTKYLKT